MLRVIVGFSFGRGNPRVWEEVPIEALMINALDVYRHSFPKITFDGELWMDSGGYQIISKGYSLEPEKVAKWQSRYNPDFAILPDNPKSPTLSLRWYKKYLASPQKPESEYVPVIHTNWQKRHIRELLEILSPNYVAIGGISKRLFPFKKEEIRKIFKLVRFFKKELGVRVHVLGVGGYQIIPLFKLLDVDSFDTTNWLHDASYGLIRVDSKAYSVQKKMRNKNTPLPRDFVCHCPACRKYWRNIRSNGIMGLRARALHNLINLINYVKKINSMTKTDIIKMLRAKD
ncbi:MAG: hypothetical protein ACTSUJ_06960 [Candidatus Njordarchaeales archaeon]